MAAKIKIGTTHRGYPERRNFLELPFEKYEFQKVWDPYQIANWAYARATGRYSFRLNFTHTDAVIGKLLYPHIRLLHFMNSISLSRTPWISTFETLIPRYHMREQDVALLAGPACRRLLALSQCARDLQLRGLKERFPAYAADVDAKLALLPPPQRPLLADLGQRTYLKDGKLTLTLVGTDLTRKSLIELLSATESLIREGYPIKLNLIGVITELARPYRVDRAEAHELERRIQGLPFVTHHLRIPNKQVLSILGETDIGLLPSYQETYGYSVLEHMASGCPVITTNIRAFPELNHPERGWLIELPLNSDREIRVETPADVEVVRGLVRDGLRAVVREVFDRPALLAEKGARAFEFIRRRHDPRSNTGFLESLYDSILG